MICYHYDHCSHTFLTVLIILTFLIVLVTLIVMMVISFIAYFFVVVIIYSVEILRFMIDVMGNRTIGAIGSTWESNMAMGNPLKVEGLNGKIIELNR